MERGVRLLCSLKQSLELTDDVEETEETELRRDTLCCCCWKGKGDCDEPTGDARAGAEAEATESCSSDSCSNSTAEMMRSRVAFTSEKMWYSWRSASCCAAREESRRSCTSTLWTSSSTTLQTSCWMEKRSIVFFKMFFFFLFMGRASGNVTR